MTDLAKLIEVLDNQQERGIRTNDWQRCTYKITEGEGRLIRLAIDNLRIAFVFTRGERFVGIYNWKE